jgi:hypothetical protein
MSAWTVVDVEDLPPIDEADSYAVYVLPSGEWWVLTANLDGYEKSVWESLGFPEDNNEKSE